MSDENRQKYLDAQSSVIGSVLIDQRVAGKVIHRLSEGDFTGEFRSIFRVIREKFLAGEPVDPVTVGAALGPEYKRTLLDIMDATPTAANVDAYIALTREKAQLLRLQECGLALSGCHDMDTARELLDKANRAISGRPGIQIMTMAQGLEDFYQRQQEKAETLSWGIGPLDNTLRSEPGDFIVIGGYPSAGKTAFSVQLAWAQAKDRRIGYFSLETKPEKLIDRTVAMVTGVDFGRIKSHTLTEDDWTACACHVMEMKERSLELIKSGGLSAADIQALSLAGRYDVIYVDYLQLIHAENLRRTDFEQVTQISKALHTMAQTTGITVVALSQLTRPERSGQNEKAPGLHSLRQSGQIEQDADGVLLLYKERPDLPDSRRCLKVAKNKEGASGGILNLDFDGATQSFTQSSQSGRIAREQQAIGRAAKRAGRLSAQMSMTEISGPDPDLPF